MRRCSHETWQVRTIADGSLRGGTGGPSLAWGFNTSTEIVLQGTPFQVRPLPTDSHSITSCGTKSLHWIVEWMLQSN